MLEMRKSGTKPQSQVNRRLDCKQPNFPNDTLRRPGLTTQPGLNQKTFTSLASDHRFPPVQGPLN